MSGGLTPEEWSSLDAQEAERRQVDPPPEPAPPPGVPLWLLAERMLARALFPGLNLPDPLDHTAWDRIAAEGRELAAERGLDLDRIGKDAEAAVAELLRPERSA